MDLTCITYNMAHIRRIIVLSHRNIINVYALKLALCFKYLCRTLFRNIFHYGCGLISLVGSQTHGIKDIDHIQGQLIRQNDGIFLLIPHIVKSVSAF